MTLFPTLFAIFINDLAEEMISTGKRVQTDDVTIPLFMYADDIVALGCTHSKTQELLDILSAWCIKRTMYAN